MVKKTRFEVEVPTRENRDKWESKVHTSSTYEGKPILAYDYQLVRVMPRGENVPPQIYNYVFLTCYALNVNEGVSLHNQ